MVFGFLQNIGPWQLLIVVAVIALLFGGSKIPELARSLGKAKGEFKKGTQEGERLLAEGGDDKPKLTQQESDAKSTPEVVTPEVVK